MRGWKNTLIKIVKNVNSKQKWGNLRNKSSKINGFTLIELLAVTDSSIAYISNSLFDNGLVRNEASGIINICSDSINGSISSNKDLSNEKEGYIYYTDNVVFKNNSFNDFNNQNHILKDNSLVCN